MRLINIVDNVSSLNYGLWNSVIVNKRQLERLEIETELWFPTPDSPDLDSFERAVKLPSINKKELLRQIILRQLSPAKDIIVTHGLWNYPTRWGYTLKKLGFKWIYVPHGMLEPWPMRQKWFKKQIYFKLIENKLVGKADLIRAVSKPEANNLKKIFPNKRVEFIPNGVDTDLLYEIGNDSVFSDVRRYLFLSRLHHKKNVAGLAEAWQESTLNNNPAYELVIAGPDQGELSILRHIMANSTNIKYVGSIFGSQKQQVLHQSSFYILPSFSEGLPSALLEAMAHGLIPIITEGCNFPEVFEKNLGIKVTTDKSSIRQGLEDSAAWDILKVKDLSERSRALIIDQYSLEAVTKQQIEIYLDTKLAT